MARPDGKLEFLGRRDDPVQLRGFRVELGKIEAALGRRPGVRECAVVLAENGRGEPFLAACYVPADPAGGDLSPALRDALVARLPRHMVPARYVAVPRLPQTLSAKLDRAALARLVASGGG